MRTIAKNPDCPECGATTNLHSPNPNWAMAECITGMHRIHAYSKATQDIAWTDVGEISDSQEKKFRIEGVLAAFHQGDLDARATIMNAQAQKIAELQAELRLSEPPIRWNEQIAHAETRTPEQQALLDTISKIEELGTHVMMTCAIIAIGVANGWLASWAEQKKEPK